MSVDKSGKNVRQMFGEIAARYDLLNHLLSLNVDRWWRWRTVRRVPPEGDAPILDLCTGTADLALAYCRASGARTTVVGADFCHPMLVVGREKIARARAADRLLLVEADVQFLPFRDNLFQITSIAFGLRNVADADRALHEMVRVLRPGGRAAILEFSMPTFAPLRAIYGLYFRRVLPRLGQWLARNRQGAYNYLPASVAEFDSGEALARRIRAAGFAQVHYQPLSFGIGTLYVGTK